MNGVVKSGKMATTILVIAFLLSLLTSLFVGDRLMSVGFISGVVGDIGKIIPAVDKIGYETNYVSVARVTIALQWLFFPVYFVLFVAQSPPSENFRFKSSKRDVKIKGVIASIAICSLSLLIVLSDFGFAGASIFRGGLFDPSFGLFWLRLPFEGKFFLAIGATIMPLIDAFCYYYVVFCVGMVGVLSLQKIRRIKGKS